MKGELKLRFELGLLENSYDYLNSSFELYKVADEYGMHDEQKTEFENKVKWKLAFVTMVQALELLLKESLFRIHPNLIYDDIDSYKISEKKTVSFQQAIDRINNFSNSLIEAEKKSFLINCSKTRNEFTHYKVNIQSEQIKSKYSVLYSIYKELHNKLIGEDIKFHKGDYKYTELEILQYDKNFTVFRGREISMSGLADFKKEIEENAQFKYYITKDGQKVERIRYGDEINRVSKEYRDLYCLSIYTDFEICDDCNAKRGEFHLEDCDLEICPICLGQIMTCECIDYMETESDK